MMVDSRKRLDVAGLFESYLRSQNYLLIIQPLDSNPKKNVLLLYRRGSFPLRLFAVWRY
jgi:hypothetical protein